MIANTAFLAALTTFPPKLATAAISTPAAAATLAADEKATSWVCAMT